jgi:hypothetical protein
MSLAEAKIYRSVSPSLHSQELLQDLQSLQQAYSKDD